MKRFIPQNIKNLYHLFVAILANICYGFPARKLKVIGVTGTDGKTTTAFLIYAILKEAGSQAGLVTSISAKIGERKEDTGFHVTSPDPVKLQKLLKRMVQAGCEYAVLEVTSHGLDQHRFFGIKFAIGVLTNISHEHLDYHKTYDNYASVKARLFRGVNYAVLNADDPSEKTVTSPGKVIRYSIESEADVKAGGITWNTSSQQIQLRDFSLKTKLLGRYNVYNILAAVATAVVLGVSKEKIKGAIEKFKPLPGRFEVIDRGQDFTVVVDFAHTPRALESVLNLCRKFVDMEPSPAKRPGFTNGRVVVVFGCAGLRDVEKRPKMGEIACHLADFVVLTAEDPRTERVEDIIEQIAFGCRKVGGVEGKTFFKVPDRAEAINFAIKKLAKAGDLVLVTGKGHEKSMCFGTTEYPWSDKNLVKEDLLRSS